MYADRKNQDVVPAAVNDGPYDQNQLEYVSSHRCDVTHLEFKSQFELRSKRQWIFFASYVVVVARSEIESGALMGTGNTSAIRLPSQRPGETSGPSSARSSGLPRSGPSSASGYGRLDRSTGTHFASRDASREKLNASSAKLKHGSLTRSSTKASNSSLSFDKVGSSAASAAQQPHGLAGSVQHKQEDDKYVIPESECNVNFILL